MDCYNLANFPVQWDGGGFTLAPGAYAEQFRCDAVSSGDIIRIQGRFVPLEPYTTYPIQTENAAYALLRVNGEHLLVYHWGNRRFAFAVWPERICRDQPNICWFDPDMVNQPRLPADWFFGVSGLHRALLLRGAPILHASYVDYRGQALLFTAPSGTGKSTQAALWAENMGAEIINGDRVLLRQCGGVWHAFGYPCCGSSQICLNRTLPLRAVVVLRQGAENSVEPLSPIQKIMALTAATVLYPWDSSEVDLAMQLAKALAQDVPVFRLTCRPDRQAVEILCQYLEENHYGANP